MSADTITTIVSIIVAFSALAAFMDRKIDGLRTDVKTDIDALRADVKADLDGVRTELKTDLDAVRTELRGDISALNDKVFALAAGLKPRIEQHEK